MARLLIHVEGQTEEAFVNGVLRNHLVTKGYHSVDAKLIGNARLREGRGGIKRWPSAKKDITNHLMEDANSIATTMVDYYALPAGEQGGWPGRGQSNAMLTASTKARCVQDAVKKDLVAGMGHSFNSNRFVPFIVMHEFEGLLFSDCAAFSRGISKPELESRFQEIRDQFATPEEINDSPETAPSKRVEALVPGYQKPFLGNLAILEIGLERIRSECPLFDAWLMQLENLVC